MERFNPVNPARNASHNVAGGPDPLKPKFPNNSPESLPKEGNKQEPQFISNSSPIAGGGTTSSISGPQFDQASGWGQKSRNWFSKYGSSVVLPIIAILILAGGIYLYATRTTEDISAPTAGISDGITDELPGLIEEDREDSGKIAENGEEIITKKTDEEPEIEVIIPEPIKKEGKIIEKAVKGDGITHLSRRALKDYLKDNPQELSKEHKVYIEDYLKDKEGPRPLEIGDEISFSEDLIKEAIDASLELAPNQLKSLEKYSALVVNL